MSDYEINTTKMASEMDKTHGPEKAEDSAPIQIKDTKDVTKAEKERQLVDKLVTWFNDWDIRRKPREYTWIEIYKRYFSVAENYKTPTRSKITVPIIFQVIEAALPKLVNTIFSNENKFFDVVPIDKSNTEDRLSAESIRRLLEVQLDKANFFIKFLHFAKQLLLYGTSYFQVKWVTERNWVWERIPNRKPRTVFGFSLGETIEWTETKSYKVVKRQPDLEVLDILDVYPDPDAQHEQDGRGYFVRSWISKEELIELGQGKYPIYGNTDKLEDLAGGAESYSESRSERYAPRGLSTSDRRKKGDVELLTFWGRCDIDGDGIKEEAQIVIADRNLIIKAKANPFHHQKRPLIRATFYPVPLEWYGIGLVEPVLSEVHELNTLRRQRLDNINQVLNAMWQADPNADVELDTLISAPNNIVLSSPLDAVRKLETPDITGNAFNEASIVQSDIERATTPASVQGSPDSGRLGRTARGAQLIISQALEKFGTATKLIEEQALRPILEMFYQLDLQFISSDEILQSPLLYKEISALKLRPEDIRADVKFKMVGISDLITTEAKVNQLISFLSIAGKVLAPVSLGNITKKIYKLMGFDENEVQLQGAQLPPGTENVIDPAMGQAVAGQAANQGAAAAPPSVPLS